MADISATQKTLQQSIADMQGKIGEETANGGLATAKAAAAKKAMAQAQTLLTKAQAVDKAVSDKQVLIDAAKGAWTKAYQPNAAKPNSKALKEQLAVAFPDENNVSADDLDNKVKPAVQALDDEIAKQTAQPKVDLKAAQDNQVDSQIALDKAAKDLNDKIQALQDLSAEVAGDLKDAGDNYASGQKSAQAGDVASLFQGALDYADFLMKSDAVAAAADRYKAAAKAIDDALAAWQTCLAAEADAEADVIDKQLALDNAVAAATALQLTRDQRALQAVKDALAPKSSKAKAA